MPYTPMELAEAFLKTGELDDALDALNQQLTENSQDELARRLRIQVLTRLNTAENLSLAISDFNFLTEMSAEDYQRLSVLQERSGNLQAAIESIRKARELAPTEERLTERHLDLLLAHHVYPEALQLVQTQERSWRWLEREGDILVLLGDDTMASARYGLVLAQLEQYEGVMRSDYLQALIARVMLARAHAFRRLGQIETAQSLYHAAQAIVPKDPTIRFNLGLLTAMQGQLETAIQECRNALNEASHALKAEMLNSLENDAQFSDLKEALLKSS